ncbi:MAG: pyridoxal-phosphate-dependent aminotransferase family protein [Labrys sp. (in: a-proteobacteria)]
MTDALLEGLKRIARTKGHAAIYVANGHGAWEAALRNTVKPGERVLLVSTGFFSHRWGEVADDLGLAVTEITHGMGEAADPELLEAALRADSCHEIRAVMAVQTETSSSVCNDVSALRAAMSRARHPALFIVDCIASLGCDRYEMDDWGVDVTVAAGQKGLMNPIGLSFVMFNDKAMVARKAVRPGRYWDWTDRAFSRSFYPRWCGSPPAHHMFALRETLGMILDEEGLEAAWRRHSTFARAVWAAVEAWGRTGLMALNISDRTRRASGVTTVNTTPGVAARIRAWCEAEAGVTLGNALGFPPEETADHFRIGHMGHLNVHMLMGTLGSIETAMVAEGLDFGPGALTAAAHALAAHRP